MKNLFVLFFSAAPLLVAAGAGAQTVADAAPIAAVPSQPATTPAPAAAGASAQTVAAAAPIATVPSQPITTTAPAAPSSTAAAPANLTAAAPASQEEPLSFVIFGLFEFGDTEAAEFRSGGRSSETMSLNDGYSAMAGLSITWHRGPDVRFESSLAIGLKYDSIGENGVELRYMSFPLQGSTQLYLGALRFGGGLSYQLAPSFKASAGGSSNELELETSLGPFLEAGLAFPVGQGGTLWLSARHLWQSMSATGQRDTEEDANAFGLSIGWAP